VVKRKSLILPAMILLAVFSYLAYSRFNPVSLLELFNFLNPPSERPATLTPEGEFALVPQEIEVGGTARTLYIPEGYRIEVFASGFKKARFMAVNPETGDLYLTEPDTGKVWNVTQRETAAEGLDNPHGIAFFEGDLYISGATSVYRFKDGEKEILIGDLPAGGNHYTSTVVFGPDGKMYVSRGSSCNVCKEDPRRAAVLRFDPDGTNEELFAAGLRNSVGLGIHPRTGELWATNNGRDWLGDDLPPEEVNIIKEGKHYGWPYCYGRNIPDPDWGNPELCADKEIPVVEMPAHSAPLGMRFTPDGEYLFVAFHGSWNRSVPTGYKIVRIEVGPNGEDPLIVDYVTGWRPEGDPAWGRPVDVIFGSEGAMYISDDYAGVIYRLALENPQ